MTFGIPDFLFLQRLADVDRPRNATLCDVKGRVFWQTCEKQIILKDFAHVIPKIKNGMILIKEINKVIRSFHGTDVIKKKKENGLKKKATKKIPL